MAKQVKREKEIRESLIHELELMGADVDVFTDMVEKYMQLWAIDQLLEEDIQERGVMFFDQSASGHRMMKNNPSVKEKVMVNQQMLRILNQLNITTEVRTKVERL